MSGSVASLSAACWQILLSSRSIGSMPACTFSVSVAVVFMAPVIAKATMRCILINCFKTLTEPVRLFPFSDFPIGLNQVSRPYVILGIKTVLYNFNINSAQTPLVGWAILLNASVHFVAFPMAALDCSAHLSS